MKRSNRWHWLTAGNEKRIPLRWIITGAFAEIAMVGTGAILFMRWVFGG